MTMKTKNLLTAMVLPALFAACTQDEFESMSQQTPMLDGRQLVENVTLNVGGAAETRLAYGTDGYSWEEGDQIGACLMDVITSDYRAANTVWHQWFTLTDYIQTNYKFTRDAEGVWSTEAKLCEGNYFFAYPYNANMGLRDAYTFTAGEQVLEGTDKESLMKAYTENNSFVGYGKVEAGDKEGEAVAVTMIPVFGSTGITITNTGTNTYTIERVVLRGAKVFDEATVNPTACTQATQYNVSVTPTNSTYFNVAQYVQDPAEDSRLGTGGYYVANWGTYDKEAALRDVLTYEQAEGTSGKVEVTINGNGTIQPQGSISVIAMVAPQERIAESTDLTGNLDQIVLDIYTDKGIISDIQLNHWYTANDANTSTTTNVLTNDNLTSIGTGNKVEVTFDDTSLDKPATMDVYNEADLANLIHWNADQAKAIKAILKADVNITKEMYDELAGSAITKATIEGSNTYSVDIEGDVADGALDAFIFNEVKEVGVNGTQSMKKSCASPIKVMSDATLNIAGNLTLAKDIYNYGTLNVNAKVNGSSGVYIKNYSQMNVAAGKEIVAGVKVVNGDSNIAFGTITNAGMIRRLVNPMGNGAYGYVVNTGIIGTEASVGDLLTNENSINNGRIDNNESGRVFLKTNGGDVYANATSTTRINDNSNGNIIITELDFNDGNFLTASDKMGNIVQEIAENASTSTVDVRANTLWLSATLTVDETNADGEYTSVDLTGTRMRNGAVTVVATGANARISGNYSTATNQAFRVKAIEVEADATLVLNNVYATISAANNVTMSGVVNHPAKLTINSNASLKVAGDGSTTINVQGGSSNNVLDNNSNNTKIALL